MKTDQINLTKFTSLSQNKTISQPWSGFHGSRFIHLSWEFHVIKYMDKHVIFQDLLDKFKGQFLIKLSFISMEYQISINILNKGASITITQALAPHRAW